MLKKIVLKEYKIRLYIRKLIIGLYLCDNEDKQAKVNSNRLKSLITNLYLQIYKYIEKSIKLSETIFL